jgi:hypothetical protein
VPSNFAADCAVWCAAENRVMDQLLVTLQQLPLSPWSAVVHLGAGHGAALPVLQRLQAERLVLVEGDAEALSRLTHRNDLPPGVEIRGLVVGASDGKTLWHRYTLAALNGPLDALAWARDYPRLRLLSSLTVDQQAASGVLQEALDGLQSPGPNLLVLDLPGQEDELLASLPGELLRRFDWIVLQGCSTPPDTTWSPAHAAVGRLAATGYVQQPLSQAADPLWPVATLHFDANAFRTQQLLAQVSGLELRCGQLEAELASSHEQCAEVHAQLQTSHQRVMALEQAVTQARALQQSTVTEQAAEQEELKRSNVAIAAERDAMIKDRDALITVRDTLEQARSELTAARDEQAKLATERQQRIDALTKDASQLTSERDALAKARTELTAARDEQAKLATERQQRIDALTKDASQLTSERDTLAKARTELTAARDEQAKLATERQQRIDALTKERAQFNAERDTWVRDRSTLVAARDEQSKAAREAKLKASALDVELVEIMARHSLLQEELIKAEAQIELIADVLLREPRA